MQILADPTRCTAACNDALPCGHDCRAACGRCLHATHPNAPPATAVAAIASKLQGGPKKHVQCAQPCRVLLLCGHPCTKLCHSRTEPCSSCKQKCWIRCCHAKCSKPCSEVPAPAPELTGNVLRWDSDNRSMLVCYFEYGNGSQTLPARSSWQGLVLVQQCCQAFMHLPAAGVHALCGALPLQGVPATLRSPLHCSARGHKVPQEAQVWPSVPQPGWGDLPCQVLPALRLAQNQTAGQLTRQYEAMHVCHALENAFSRPLDVRLYWR